MKKALLASGLALLATATHAADFTFQGAQVDLYGDLVVGAFDDMALYQSAGRERQMKFAHALIGADAHHRLSGWGGVIELNLAVDEPKVDPSNQVYTDYYKNLGADLYYYGDLPRKNAYLRYANGSHTLRFGRMENVHGFDPDSLPYWGRWGSPHMLYLDKGLNTGIAYRYEHRGLALDGFVFMGQDRPDRGGNYYLNGQTDPQTDGNSYPGYELKASYTLERGSQRLTGFASYHHDKTGSAPGKLYSGKHNDERTAIGFDAQGSIPYVRGAYWHLIAQQGLYIEGLTEDGGQGRATPLESFDIEREGRFVTAGIGYGRVRLYYTHEELDRADVEVWDKIAGFDPAHPAMDAKETNRSIQLSVQLTPSIEAVALYRTTDNPYPELSGIGRDHGDDRRALYLRARF